MKFTLYTHDNCQRCKNVEEALKSQKHEVEVFTPESLAAYKDIVRRSDIMTAICSRLRNDLPIVFREDVLVEVEDLELQGV